ncbi:MAG TPA: Ig-like domain-containing protein [Verrucomicrobiae bacterium]
MKIRNAACFMVGLKPLSFLLLVGFLGTARAQVSDLPVVSLYATDPHASWAGDPGQFTVVRRGPTNATLNVFCRIGGTATNSIDYQPVGNIVTIPAGARSSAIQISPVDLGQTDTRTVALVLAPAPTMPPVNYLIGTPSNAVVVISRTAAANLPPAVRIMTPANGATFVTPVNIPICASAIDLDGYVRKVEFFAGEISLGVTTNNPLSAGPMNPFCLVWSNVAPGNYALRALATDNGGATTMSAPVAVSVVAGPPSTNYPPVVRIASPPYGAVFPAPATIPIYAYARDADDLVASVEFFDGLTSLGFGSNICAVSPTPMPRCPTNSYVLIWTNAPLGLHLLRAEARDVRGASSRSEPVLVNVVNPPPPRTNWPPVVTIAATDPIAIEGTNCWPWPGLTNRVPAWSNWVGSPVTCVWFTNCGPKNATFVVRRMGSTNAALTVTYGIGGTATNGVDYVPLPGSVTIPAGERRASIEVVPIDDGLAGATSTVVLRLEPSAKEPPDYLLGYPRSAAALIVDGPWPQRRPRLLADGSFHLSTDGPDGAWFHVEYSMDMVDWVPICTNQVVNGSIDFIDPDASMDGSRFYRAVPELDPSVQ